MPPASPSLAPQPAADPPIAAPPRPPRVAILSQPAAARAPAPDARQSAGERRLLLAAWVLSIAVLVLAGWAAVAWRDGIMRTWPPSERAYAALGLAGPARR